MSGDEQYVALRSGRIERVATLSKGLWDEARRLAGGFPTDVRVSDDAEDL